VTSPREKSVSDVRPRRRGNDKQDQTLARPSQLEACRRKATELGGEIACEFFDQEPPRTTGQAGPR
jgi:hypothetical protein